MKINLFGFGNLFGYSLRSSQNFKTYSFYKFFETNNSSFFRTVVQGADHVLKVLNGVAVTAVDDRLTRKNIVKSGDLIINHRVAAIINGQDPGIGPESVQDVKIRTDPHTESVRIAKVQVKLKR